MLLKFSLLLYLPTIDGIEINDDDICVLLNFVRDTTNLIGHTILSSQRLNRLKMLTCQFLTVKPHELIHTCMH